MERRAFLMGIFGLAGVAATAGLLVSKAEAAPLAQLKNLMPPAAEDGLVDAVAETPDGTAIEEVQYPYGHRPRGPYVAPRNRYRGRNYRRAPLRRPRVRCRTYRNRWGQPVRRCN